ncbi:hypothetical protein JK358_28040 [Nocardia sp. 2]|uniref:Secreted protein n=1 Tax=Nocardia acididurans TaxID=2802282 RepID=A0ABS1MDV4_9NOCA|nr:hypothetical protein [Nocardia acididurans]MBL1078265.1 hypothetical protein [Nocardia acididurans]
MVFAVFLLAGVPARADGVAAGADLMVAQSLGDRELTVIIRRAEPVPGPLRVEIVNHQGSPPGRLTLTALPTDRVGESVSAAVDLTDRTGIYPALLRVDAAGPWELTVADGERTARIPFLVAAPLVMPWEKAAYGGFFAAGVLLVVSLGTALTARRGRITLLPVGAMVAAVAVGVTGSVLSGQAPAPRAAGTLIDPTSGNIGTPYPERELPLTTDYSRPPVNWTVRGDGAEVALSLTDAATGRPVDDLLVHDDALLHLMVVGPSGRFWHRHPIRVAPGEYRVRLPFSESGDYAFAAEIARRGGGTQLLRSALRVADTSGSGAPPPATSPIPITTTGTGTGTGEVTTTDLIAGKPGTLTAHFGGNADLQPWLGMIGHLIAVGPLPADTATGTAAAAAPIWVHAHAMPPPPAPGAQAPDETVAAYGPDVSFTHTFPQPGRYLVWAQAERAYSVLTVPATVEVRAEGLK